MTDVKITTSRDKPTWYSALTDRDRTLVTQWWKRGWNAFMLLGPQMIESTFSTYK